MRLLLDSHTFLWAAVDPERLSGEAREAIDDGENFVCVSVATIWEIAIKVNVGKLKLQDDVGTILRRSRFATVTISIDHAVTAGALPRHHGDPFDRMLVAQAKLEDCTLVTRDPVLARYGVPTLQA